MKTTASRKPHRNRAARYVWSPAIDLRSGWILCVLNPYASG